MNPERREKLKDMGTMAAGAAIGGGLGYLASKKLNKSYGEALKKAPPALRLKYLIPASTGVVGAAALAKIFRNRDKIKQIEMRKMSSFEKEWVLNSLRGPRL
tara:strand:+ start:393 stop:698 length:306 start_codon:yes stop_codon:yes gene_type:complete